MTRLTYQPFYCRSEVERHHLRVCKFRRQRLTLFLHLCIDETFVRRYTHEIQKTRTTHWRAT